MKRTKNRLFAIGSVLLLMLITECVGFARGMPRGMGLVWLPLAMLFFERIGIVTANTYLSYWRLAIMVISLIAATLVPPDPWTFYVLAFLLTLLYFGGIALCKWMPCAGCEESKATPPLKMIHEPLQDDRQVSCPEFQKRPWQFSLRSLFVVTTVVAVLLSLATSRRFEFLLWALTAGATLTLVLSALVGLFHWTLNLHLWKSGSAVSHQEQGGDDGKITPS